MSPRFLVANDDGFAAQGVRTLADRLRALGEVWVVTPDRERSATSHAISLHKPLRITRHGPREFSLDGTPTDSVYVALHHLMDEPPDLVLSGINHGPNLGNDVIYSGTVSAAMEGALFGYPALAVSLCVPDHQAPFDLAHFETAADFAAKAALSVLERPMPTGVLLNINVPALPRERIRGAKLCRLGYTDWAEAVTVRQDPRGRPYYWIGGERSGHDTIVDSDNAAVAQGLIAVTPIHYDLTDYRSFAYARGLALDGFASTPDTLGNDPLPHPRHPRAAADARQKIPRRPKSG
ncbi:MAG: 5'/3'-nucleotidase SurE [Deltaproteobacteria bacterium]|nr:5'/3'-nucleotidase SurE [Deltaproteobacteria bacterium]